ncbi:MAG: primosomal protein N', partial [Phycisphaerae bacterium]
TSGANPAEREVPSKKQLILIPEAGVAQVGTIAEIAVQLPTLGTYTYGVPEELAQSVQAGSSVRVPFGRSRRIVSGICIGLSQKPWTRTLAFVQAAESPPFVVSASLTDLSRWIAEYYVCNPFKVMRTVLGPGRALGAKRLSKMVTRSQTPAPDHLTEKQRAVLDVLDRGTFSLADILRDSGVTRAVITRLVSQKLVTIESVESAVPSPALRMNALDSLRSPQDDLVLTADQARALSRIESRAASFGVFCLFGPPGSGKTEVYVRAIRAAIAANRQAILLIPEIALATQIAERLARRFPRVAILHSQLTNRQRADALAAIAAGEVDVVIGTRNAVFAPLPRLGLMVVDEEQESSFKSLGAPFFHARDVAIKRAQIERVPVVLGSATPSIETWYNVQHRSGYELLELRGRVPGAEVPRVELVLANEQEEGHPRLVSPPLLRAVKRVVKEKRHAMILHNRRGYATALCCSDCRLVLRCTRCHAFLVLHRDTGQLHCHRCGARTAPFERCPTDSCPGAFHNVSLAIQRLEEDLRAAIPGVQLIRLDSDTMKKRADYEAALQNFGNTPGAVLIGTQMIAKGLDFATVDLVGVIDADAALHLPDFRAREYAFQLLMQVVGRAGRSEGESQAIVQVSELGDPTIADAIAMDYPSFATRELRLRERFRHPPFVRLVRIVLSDSRPGRAKQEAEAAVAALREFAAKHDPRLIIEDAEPCLAARMRDLNRFHFLVRAHRAGAAQSFLARASADKVFRPNVQRTTIDVDPYDFA